MEFKIFEKDADRLKQGVQGIYPDALIEQTKEHSEIRHAVNEALVRPWIRHFFLAQILRDSGASEDTVMRNRNIIEIFKTTIPLPENSFVESAMSSWQMFIGSAFRETDTPWYNGIRKTMIQDRFYSAIEQLELEIPKSNPQHSFQFHDHSKHLRRIPRVPIKLIFSLPGNERENIVGILRQAMNTNPHNVDVALLIYCFFKAWGRTRDFLDLARQENRPELEEWYFWIENDMNSLGALKREAGDYSAAFFIYDRALLSPVEQKEIADWFLKESEFKSAYHFYYKAKEFETALELLQNISVKARQHFDRETIETKYAFGELTDDEYQRLLRQLVERSQ